MKTAFYLVILSSLLISSCGSVQMVPVSYTKERPDEVISTISDNRVELFVEHWGEDPNQLVFDLQVNNTGNEMIRIQPEEIRIFGSQEPFPEGLATDHEVVQAIVFSQSQGAKAMSDTEVNRYFKRRIRSRQAAQIALMVASIALVVNDVVNDVEDSKKEYWTSNDANRAARREVLTFTGLLTADLLTGMLEDEKIRTIEDLKYLPKEYFFEELIYPQGSSRGKIFFKYSIVYNYYRVIVPVEGINYVFDFRKAFAGERRYLRRLQ